MICSCFFNVVKKRRICISDEKKNMSASYTCVCFRASDGEIERERAGACMDTFGFVSLVLFA